MGWARFDDCYSDHPKIAAAGALPELLDMRAIIYSARYETDGRIAREVLPRLCSGITNPNARARRLVEVGRWREIADGWEIVDYLEYNPSKTDKDAERAAARDRMARARSSRSSPEHQANNDRSSDNPVPIPLLRNSSTDSLTRADARPVEDERIKLGQVNRSRAMARMARASNVRNRDAYETKVLEELGRDRERTLELIRKFPDADAGQLGAHLDGEPTTLGRYVEATA